MIQKCLLIIEQRLWPNPRLNAMAGTNLFIDGYKGRLSMSVLTDLFQIVLIFACWLFHLFLFFLYPTYAFQPLVKDDAMQ